MVCKLLIASRSIETPTISKTDPQHYNNNNSTIMAVVNTSQLSKKRDRLAMTASSAEDHEEYERAVAFLREFHSRAAATHLHSMPLDAILEADGATSFDEMLASDFALALSVGTVASNNNGCSNSSSKPLTMKRSSKSSSSFVLPHPDETNKRPRGGMRRTTSSSVGTGLSRMKKITTSKCLSDLANNNGGCGCGIGSNSTSDLGSSANGDDAVPSSVPSRNSFGSGSFFELRRDKQQQHPRSGLFSSGIYPPSKDPATVAAAMDNDYYLGYDNNNDNYEMMMIPMTKRHRRQHCGHASS